MNTPVQRNQTLYQKNKMANVCRYIDDAIHPTNMPPEEAREFLESLQMEIESRLEAVNEDIRRADGLNDFGGDL